MGSSGSSKKMTRRRLVIVLLFFVPWDVIPAAQTQSPILRAQFSDKLFSLFLLFLQVICRWQVKDLAQWIIDCKIAVKTTKWRSFHYFLVVELFDEPTLSSISHRACHICVLRQFLYVNKTSVVHSTKNSAVLLLLKSRCSQVESSKDFEERNTFTSAPAAKLTS